MRDIQFGTQVRQVVLSALAEAGWYPEELGGESIAATGTGVLRVTRTPVTTWPPDSEMVYLTLEAADRPAAGNPGQYADSREGTPWTEQVLSKAESEPESEPERGSGRG